jgi:CBS domain-containing protein
MTNTDKLADISQRLLNRSEVEPVTVREFLSWFGAQRRGSFIVFRIRFELEKAGLTTFPDFESAYLDSLIRFRLAETTPPQASPSATQHVNVSVDDASASPQVEDLAPNYADPTYRLSKLAAANRTPVAVSPDSTLQQATTLMISNDFSQLPVMTSKRDVKGIISWSSIGSRLALGVTGSRVSEFMEQHRELGSDASIFQAIATVVDSQYVLIRGPDKQIVGIVTATDLSIQFQQLAEPFLLLGEIENHLRRVLIKNVSRQQLVQARDPKADAREITGVEDLTFGEYVRLFENPALWPKINLPIDRVIFCDQLTTIRRIRNDVMHFDPDGIPPDDLSRLRDFVQFLRRLQNIGVT